MNGRVCNGRTVLSVALAAAMVLTGWATIRRSEARSTDERRVQVPLRGRAQGVLGV